MAQRSQALALIHNSKDKLFLRGMHAIDLRQEGPENREEIRKLVEAITTKRDLFS